MSDSEQVELIADKFAKVSNEYEVLDRKQIELQNYSIEDIPKITPGEVKLTLEELKLNKSERLNDIPAKIFKHFSNELAKPLSCLINECIVRGNWPKFLKLEIVTPVPKVSKPETIDQLRNISGLMNLDKIMERPITVCQPKGTVHSALLDQDD